MFNMGLSRENMKISIRLEPQSKKGMSGVLIVGM